MSCTLRQALSLQQPQVWIVQLLLFNAITLICTYKVASCGEGQCVHLPSHCHVRLWQRSPQAC